MSWDAAENMPMERDSLRRGGLGFIGLGQKINLIAYCNYGNYDKGSSNIYAEDQVCSSCCRILFRLFNSPIHRRPAYLGRSHQGHQPG